jgi:PEP-CTERM motif
MKTMKLTAAAGTILVASSILGSSAAWAGACSAGSVTSYEAPGFSCSVGPLTFNSFSFTPSASLDASVSLTSVAPWIGTWDGHQEYGFILSYVAAAGPGPGLADVAITYNVTDATGSMTDAYMNLNGVATGGAEAFLSELLNPNGATLTIDTVPGEAGVTFAPISSLSAEKDQTDDSLAGGTVVTSQLVDAFSVGTSVPEPGVLALFGAALFGGTFWLRRRRG